MKKLVQNGKQIEQANIGICSTMKQELFTIGCLLFIFTVFAQPTDTSNTGMVKYFSKSDNQVLDAIIVDGDTIPILVLDEVLFLSTPTFDSDEAQRRFYILRRKVHKVYPYAVIAGNKLDSLNLLLAGFSSERKKKKYIKKFQKYLEGRFEDELKNLTRTEGQILSKLISRETDITTYELITTYRSGWTAFWWNTAASFYDIDLKIPYDPTGIEEDKLIENILLRAFINGSLEERIPITSLD